jgi:DNA-binding CsgD family transcriptional regulator
MATQEQTTQDEVASVVSAKGRPLSIGERRMLLRIIDAAPPKENTLEEDLLAARSGAGSLTARERQVLEFVMGGISNKGIGRALHISPRTVEVYRGRVISKLHARSTGHLCMLATHLGFSPRNDT